MSVEPLRIELYLEHSHIVAVCRQVGELRRLVDILNHGDEMLELEEASVTLSPALEPRTYAKLTVPKVSILAAVPHETPDDNRRRTLLANIVAKPEKTQKALTLIVPPLIIAGSTHISVGGAQRRFGDVFARFFPVTSATVSIDGQADGTRPVILVGRDHVVGTSPLQAPKQAMFS